MATFLPPEELGLPNFDHNSKRGREKSNQTNKTKMGKHRLTYKHPDVKYVKNLFETGKLTGEEEPSDIFDNSKRLQKNQKSNRKNFVQKLGRLRSKWLADGTFEKGKSKKISCVLFISLSNLFTDIFSFSWCSHAKVNGRKYSDP